MMKAFLSLITALAVTLMVVEGGCSDEIKAAGIVYCPYTCDADKGGQEGFMTEVAKTVFKRAGHTYTVTMMPFARALESVVEGKYDALAICNKADVPEGGLVFPDLPIALVKNTFAVRKDEEWSYQGIDSLKHVTIGSVVGYTWRDEALNHYMAVTGSPAVQRVGGEHATQMNLKKLLAGRIDAYLDDPNMILRVATEMRVADKIRFEADVSPTPHFIGFTPGKEKSERYARILGEGMRELRKRGELAEILARYGIEDWEKGNQGKPER